MTKTEKAIKVAQLKNEANHAKDRLLSIAQALEDLGVTGEAVKLYTIIGKLETWQNR